MRNPTKIDPEELQKARDERIIRLREKIDNKEELTDDEKDLLFHALNYGSSNFVYIPTEKRAIYFSDYLSTYLWWGQTGEKIELLHTGYAPDKETIAREFRECRFTQVIGVTEIEPKLFDNRSY